MEVDPEEEVEYRLSLAKEHLESADKRFKIEDWPGTVESSQLAVENAAKAIIAHFCLPSWSHDPSAELEEILDKIPNGVRELVCKLIEMVRTLAPEHGRTTYGITSKRITPQKLYARDHAEKALGMAREATKISEAVLRQLGYRIKD
jgi:HEPN domain-containing protein